MPVNFQMPLNYWIVAVLAALFVGFLRYERYKARRLSRFREAYEIAMTGLLSGILFGLATFLYRPFRNNMSYMNAAELLSAGLGALTFVWLRFQAR